jgi:DNA-binding GntR family transcriptional regulator
MVRQLCAVPSPTAQVAQLRKHLRTEADAVARTDVAGRTRLLADFHVVLARLLGNEVLAQLLADLLSRSLADRADVPVVALGRHSPMNTWPSSTPSSGATHAPPCA